MKLFREMVKTQKSYALEKTANLKRIFNASLLFIMLSELASECKQYKIIQLIEVHNFIEIRNLIN